MRRPDAPEADAREVVDQGNGSRPRLRHVPVMVPAVLAEELRDLARAEGTPLKAYVAKVITRGIDAVAPRAEVRRAAQKRVAELRRNGGK